MEQPEVKLRRALLAAGIEAFTTLDHFDRDEFVVIVRTSDGQTIHDVNHVFKDRNYNLLLQCFKKGSKLEAIELADRVIQIVDDLFWQEDVVAASYAGGTPLPAMNEHEVYSVSYLISITN